MLALAIDAGFVGDCHACMKWGRLPGVSNLMRSFVDAQIRANAMTCAVTIVDAVLPHRISSQCIYLSSADAIGETAQCQTDMSLE